MPLQLQRVRGDAQKFRSADYVIDSHTFTDSGLLLTAGPAGNRSRGVANGGGRVAGSCPPI